MEPLLTKLGRSPCRSRRVPRFLEFIWRNRAHFSIVIGLCLSIEFASLLLLGQQELLPHTRKIQQQMSSKIEEEYLQLGK